ncbi:hypothetical protein [Ottowia sp.]|uniref:hypothetical protein n=1 Tax=Ottowia sp. TaxID=1898956 RepID=UPI0025E93AFF|nr:hypothetical protein [Ottowia sp.]MBK6616712.1 hypothetical protein [Ottowia sp.]
MESRFTRSFRAAFFTCSLAIASIAIAGTGDEMSLRDHLQIGSRITRGAKSDTLEVKFIISPEVRLYAAPKTIFQSLSVTPTGVTSSQPTLFRMADGSRHDVHAGTLTMTAFFPKSALSCGAVVRAVVQTQGCTVSLCFPPENIPIVASTESC